MRIGVDFDGVIADNTKELQKFYLDNFGVRLSMRELNKKNQIKILGSLDKYNKVHRNLSIGISTLQNEVTLDCKRILSKLISDGHKIIILTGREKLAWKRAKEFMKAKRIPYNHMLYNNLDREFTKREERMTKAYISQRLKLDIFIDDMIKHLILMSGSGIKLFLFTTAQNMKEVITKPDIERVSNWKDIYNSIQQRVVLGIAELEESRR